MLVVTIDLVPGGYEPLRRTIGSMQIANRSNLGDISDYSVEIVEAANALTGEGPRNAACVVERHDRRQNVWALLEKACAGILKAKFVEL